jgi:hypothetical protein
MFIYIIITYISIYIYIKKKGGGCCVPSFENFAASSQLLPPTL